MNKGSENFQKIVIQEAIARLQDGVNRLKFSEYSESSFYTELFGSPFEEEYEQSDYGEPSKYIHIQKEFMEEVYTIEKILLEKNIPDQTYKKQRSEIEQKFINSTHRRSYALSIWDQFSIPIRKRDNRIYMIYSPRDIMGTPIIHCYTIEDYNSKMIMKATKSTIQCNSYKNKYNAWKGFGLFVILIVFCFIIIKYC